MTTTTTMMRKTIRGGKCLMLSAFAIAECDDRPWASCTKPIKQGSTYVCNIN